MRERPRIGGGLKHAQLVPIHRRFLGRVRLIDLALLRSA
jgi:hypothetical protein